MLVFNIRILFVMFSIFLVFACGGGSGSNGSDVVPPPPVETPPVETPPVETPPTETPQLLAPELVAPSAQVFVVNTAINNLALSNSGGEQIVSCSGDGIPQGLSVDIASDESTCILTGTPTAAQPEALITLTATNATGTGTVSFSITVRDISPYITKWDTRRSGMSESNQLTIFTSPDQSYDFTVDWGDGNIDTNVTSNITNTYETGGIYTVTITGDYPHIFTPFTQDVSENNKLLSVVQWGEQQWKSMHLAFAYTADVLTIEDEAAPDLGQVEDMSFAFFASEFDLPINHWDVSTVTNMEGMFKSAGLFNQALDAWSTGNVTNMASMFEDAADFNKNIDLWNVSAVTNMSAMFKNAESFNQAISNWDVSLVQSMDEMFLDASEFNQDISMWQISNVTTFDDFLTSSNFSTANYDLLLTNWALQDVQSNVVLDIDARFSAAGLAGRQRLMNVFLWNVSDFGEIAAPNLSFNSPSLTLYTNSALEFLLSNSGSEPQTCTLSSDNDIAGFDVQVRDGTCLLSALQPNTLGSTQITVVATNAIGSSSITFNFEVLQETPYITTWKTDNEGHSDDNQIHLDLNPNFDYDFTVDWGDGVIQTNITEDVTHTYDSPGIKTISITGTYPASFFDGDDGDSDTTKLLTVEQWGQRSWLSFERAYFGADNLQILDLLGPDLSSVRDMSFAFAGANNFDSDISAWEMDNVTDLNSMFQDALLFNQDISQWNVTSVVNMNNMFLGALAFNQPIGDWDVSNVTSMRGMFRNAQSFNQALNLWVTTSVNNMFDMFREANAFNQPIGDWDVSNVEFMGNMFLGGQMTFNQNLSDWVTTNVTTMEGMFANNKVFNQPLDNWDVSNVTSMRSMFFDADAFNQDLNSWVTSSVINMNSMFARTRLFNGNISAWDVSGVTSMVEMFREARGFNQDISGWTVDNVTTMRRMFFSTNLFDQDLSAWVINSESNVFEMFRGANLSIENYDSLLNAWSQQPNLPREQTFNVSSNFSRVGQDARQVLIDDFAWTVIDNGLVD